MFIIISIGISGCNEVSNTLNPDLKKFVGTWQNITTDVIPPENVTLTTTKIYTFFSDGTFIDNNVTGWYKIKDDKFVMYYGEEVGIAFNYYFSNSDKTLTLSLVSIPNEMIVFTKQ